MTEKKEKKNRTRVLSGAWACRHRAQQHFLKQVFQLELAISLPRCKTRGPFRSQIKFHAHSTWAGRLGCLEAQQRSNASITRWLVLTVRAVMNSAIKRCCCSRGGEKKNSEHTARAPAQEEDCRGLLAVTRSGTSDLAENRGL